MAQTNVSIRMDEDLKKQFDKFCTEAGMTMTTAVCIFAKTVVRQQRIPFEIAVDPFYSDEHIAELERRYADVKAGRNMHEHELIEEDDE